MEMHIRCKCGAIRGVKNADSQSLYVSVLKDFLDQHSTCTKQRTARKSGVPTVQQATKQTQNAVGQNE
jgi:hypothetical protein